MAYVLVSVVPPAGWDVFPELPGRSFPSDRTPHWEYRERRSSSGRLFRSTYWSWPIWKFKLSFEFLRNRHGYDEADQLVGFFNKMQGGVKAFLFRDSGNYSVTDAVFGVGDGIRTEFALTRTVGGIAEPVGAAIVFGLTQAGSTTTAYQLLDSRLVRFTVAPSVGATLRWSGFYWLRCVFTDKGLATQEFNTRLFSAKSVQIETVKP